jgi:hypothetical protein
VDCIKEEERWKSKPEFQNPKKNPNGEAEKFERSARAELSGSPSNRAYPRLFDLSYLGFGFSLVFGFWISDLVFGLGKITSCPASANTPSSSSS